MSEYTPGQPAPDSQPQAEPPPTPSPVSGATSGLPSWLPYFLLAAVPALIVGLVVYLTAGGGDGEDSSAAGLLDGFIRLNGSEAIQTFENEPPPGYPSEIPFYPDSKLVVSFLITSEEGASYFVIYQTEDQPNEVLSHFQDSLDQDPWQVEISQSSEEFNGLRFSRPDDADVVGDVSVNTSELDGQTNIYVSYQDLTPTSEIRPSEKEFVLPVSLSLPAGFPTDIPIYQGREDSTVTGTYFERGQGTTNFLITFLTLNSQDDVIEFYRGEFEKRGWQVMDSTSTPVSSFELSIDFVDGPAQDLTGSIRADNFEDDSDYTRVDMLLQINPTRGRGN